MKRIIPITLVVFFLSSCLETKSEYTPEITMSKLTKNDGTTLDFRYDGNLNLYNVDSIHVGDTLVGAVGFASLANNLISTHIDWDSTCMHLWSTFTSDFTGILLSNSDTATLDLYYPTGYNYAGLPLHIVPLKAGSTPLKLTVVTDSKFSPAEEVVMLNITDN